MQEYRSGDLGSLYWDLFTRARDISRPTLKNIKLLIKRFGDILHLTMCWVSIFHLIKINIRWGVNILNVGYTVTCLSPARCLLLVKYTTRYINQCPDGVYNVLATVGVGVRQYTVYSSFSRCLVLMVTFMRRAFTRLWSFVWYLFPNGLSRTRGLWSDAQTLVFIWMVWLFPFPLIDELKESVWCSLPFFTLYSYLKAIHEPKGVVSCPLSLLTEEKQSRRAGWSFWSVK